MRHKRAGEDPCAACVEANRAYFRAWRKTHPNVYSRLFSRGAARNRALTRLAREQPARFRELYADELGAEERKGG
jgi:hypothetical protein